MSWKLYLDDVRPCPVGFILATSSKEAVALVRELGMPEFMSLDHDLGNEDTTMAFLHGLVNDLEITHVPDYVVHSANPVGRDNIIVFLESYKRRLE